MPAPTTQSCELCAKRATTRARVEGVAMSVCAACAQFGVELTAPQKPAGSSRARDPVVLRERPRGPAAPVDDGTELVVDAAKRIRDARSRRGITLADAARLLLIRESTLRHYESGTMQPSDADVRKLERVYLITLRVPGAE